MNEQEQATHVRTLAENEALEQAAEERGENENQKIRQKMMEQRTYRKGKTQRDRARGEAQRRAGNRAERASWQKSNNTPFPIATCNGKKNRHRVTGKDGQTVYLKGGIK